MITTEQLKNVESRCEQLKRYLDIDSKKIEVEEEELRTHVADFWDDREKAEAQMRKIKGLHFWIDSYTVLEKQVEELSLAMDFLKEGLVEEGDIDAQYAVVEKELEKADLTLTRRTRAGILTVFRALAAGEAWGVLTPWLALPQPRWSCCPVSVLFGDLRIAARSWDFCLPW